MLDYSITAISFCQQVFLLFSNFFDCFLSSERRRRDLNPRAAINDLHPFQGCPFGLLGTSPSKQISYSSILSSGCFQPSPKRREWDSNPRALADKRFSRPPRYDHFDISPSVATVSTAKIILAKSLFSVNTFFTKNSKNYKYVTVTPS